MISIVIPTLNEEEYLTNSINQYKNKLNISYEVIVSDGKSTDKTLKIAHELADKVVENNSNTRQNIAQGRNAGGNQAIGEFLVFMDADSRIKDPDIFFKKAIECFDNDKNLLGMTATLRVYPETETFLDKLVLGIINFNLRVMNNYLHIGEATGEFQMIRRESWLKLKGYREDLVTREDSDMFLRLSKIGRTFANKNLTVFHSGRRAHKVGWPKLLFTNTTNVFWVFFFNRAKSQEWKVIR